MHQIRRTYVSSDIKVADLIFENSSLLLMMEYFELDIVVKDKSVQEICQENNIPPQLFVAIANLYNGFKPSEINPFKGTEVITLINFLKNTHNYYLEEKIPEIKNYLTTLYSENNNKEIKLIENFLNDYSQEVKEHLDYEDNIAFPYFISLTKKQKSEGNGKNEFSAEEYLDHHSDIETKLTDLKMLLLKHISLKNNPPLRRKLVMGLFDLEYNLNIHSLIEESILIPIIKTIEKQQVIE